MLIHLKTIPMGVKSTFTTLYHTAALRKGVDISVKY